MTFTIRLFAAARQLAGTEIIRLELSEPVTVARLRQALAEQYPPLQSLLPHVRFAVNAEYVSEERLLQSDDEIACIPPVSGG